MISAKRKLILEMNYESKHTISDSLGIRPESKSSFDFEACDRNAETQTLCDL